MSVRLPSDLLRRSPEEGARLLALAYLDEISLAKRRLADPQDLEALHDFRVGLRRLRSAIRAYRSQLKDSVSRKLRSKLRDLTAATNPGRDIEVQLEWLHRQAARLGPGETEGIAWLIGRLEGRKYESIDRVTAAIGERFLKAAGKLRRLLETFEMKVRTGREPTPASFGEVTGKLVQELARDLSECLQAVSKPEQVSEAHAARISAKRLRYLVEPLGRRAPGAKALGGRLKQMQERLGHVHDLQVILQEIESSLNFLSRGAPGRPLAAKRGLEALRHLATEEAGASFASFQAEWSRDRAVRFLARADELGRLLVGRAQAEEESRLTSAMVPEENGKPVSNGQRSNHGSPIYSQNLAGS